MEKCGCRFNCIHHDSMYSETNGVAEPMTLSGKCPNKDEHGFARVVCPVCQYTQIYTVCELCWKRMNAWLRGNARWSCEKCRKGNRTKGSWSLYKDVKTNV